ncbi:MAG TPA: DUF4014 domain-containing protein [candidate division CPR3 bacterium]|uniref:DUF4014 domain-containing protein n=1 Tax=candidate division CPR3 bacterium TaxID=2268181 RepID=A0A7C1NZM2_UNCC3|nr:DUF4014 domain-containing protein [candidate division CPR3 bacterium]
MPSLSNFTIRGVLPSLGCTKNLSPFCPIIFACPLSDMSKFFYIYSFSFLFLFLLLLVFFHSYLVRRYRKWFSPTLWFRLKFLDSLK